MQTDQWYNYSQSNRIIAFITEQKKSSYISPIPGT